MHQTSVDPAKTPWFVAFCNFPRSHGARAEQASVILRPRDEVRFDLAPEVERRYRGPVRFSRVFSILLALAVTSCASMHVTPSATRYGAAKSSKGEVEASEDFLEEEVKDVEVSVGVLPKGISVANGGTLQVDDPAHFELLGTVKATGDGADFFVFTFYPYVEGERWRRGLCYWQVPLNWVTLSIWSFVSPLHYPCKVGAPNSTSAIDERKARLIGSMRRTTKALGGNVLVVTSLGGTKLIHAQTGDVLGTTEATVGEGIALRKKE